MSSRPDFTDKIKKSGMRLTRHRAAILDVLVSTHDHLSAEDIYMRVHKDYPAVGLTTVYRTLEAFTDLGMLVHFDFGDKRLRYELAEEFSPKKHHHHLICRKCGQITDYTDFLKNEVCLIKSTESELSKKYDFKIEAHQVHFYGLCRKCKE